MPHCELLTTWCIDFFRQIKISFNSILWSWCCIWKQTQTKFNLLLKKLRFFPLKSFLILKRALNQSICYVAKFSYKCGVITFLFLYKSYTFKSTTNTLLSSRYTANLHTLVLLKTIYFFVYTMGEIYIGKYMILAI